MYLFQFYFPSRLLTLMFHPLQGGSTALIAASIKGRLPIVQHLILNGANVDAVNEVWYLC